MALMMHKSEDSYFGVLNEVNKRWNAANVNFDRIHVDFESGHINALWAIYGKEKVFGCYFHFAQALIRYIRKECPIIAKKYNEKQGDVYKRVIY